MDLSTYNRAQLIKKVKELHQELQQVKAVDARNIAEADFSESKELYLAFINGSEDMIFLKDDQFRYLFANDTIADFFKTTKEAMIGKTDQELAEVSKIAPCVSSDEKALVSASPFMVEELLGDRYCETTKFPVVLKNNKKGIGGIIRDISKRKQMETMLQQSESRYRSIVAVSNTGAWEYHRKTNFLWASPEYFEMLGDHQDNYIMDGTSNLEATWVNLIHPDDRQRAVNHFKHYLETGSVGMYENYFRMRHTSGSWVWIWSRGQTLRNPDGSLSDLTVGTHINITENKLAEEALLKEKEKFAKILKTAPAAICMFLRRPDKSVCFSFAGPEIKNIYGFTAEQIQDDIKLVQKYVHPDDRYRIRKEIAGSARSLTPWHSEYRFLNPEKGLVWTENHFIPEREADGTITWYGFIHDITGQKSKKITEKVLYDIAHATFVTSDLEELALAIRKHLSELIDTSNFYIALYDESTEMLSIPYEQDEKDNIEQWPAEKSMTGLVIQEQKPLLLKKSDILRLMDEGIIEQVGNMCEVWLGVPLLKGDQAMGAVVVQSYQNKDMYDESSREILEFASYQISQAIQRQKTIEDLVLARDTARESELRFKALHNASFGGIAIHDKGIILDCNQGLSEITGFSTEELIGMDGLLLIAENSRDMVMKNILAGYEKPYETTGVRKNGEQFPIRIEAKNIPYKGKPLRVTEFRDISEDKKREKELRVALDKAQESDRLKSAFLANMSHEIRTPMNGILGFADLLKNPQLSREEQDMYVDIIENSGKRMLNIINDIVDISRIEAGVVEVELAESNINEQLEYIHRFFKPEAGAKGIQLVIAGKLPAEQAILFTDHEKVLAILINLVKNALKYSKKGTIEYGCRKKGSFLEFFVCDTGIGIPKERQEAIFDRFVQADIEDKDALQGAGLGLAISKAYVEMLGGQIRVESEVGKGSSFYCTIPWKTEAEKKAIPESDDVLTAEVHPIKKLKLLIVEDDEMSSMLMSKYVQHLCKEILYTKNGTETLEVCKQHPDIDLILMDIKMPGIAGDEVTRRIRQFNKDVVIIAQTAKALTGDRDSAMKAGFDEYLTKPICKRKLLRCIEDFMKSFT